MVSDTNRDASICRTAARIGEIVVAELTRPEHVVSVYDATSELE
jgi:hypothetical protein